VSCPRQSPAKTAAAMLTALNLMKTPLTSEAGRDPPQGHSALGNGGRGLRATPGDLRKTPAGPGQNAEGLVCHKGHPAGSLKGRLLAPARHCHSTARDLPVEATSRLNIPRPKVATNNFRDLGSNLSCMTGAAGRPLPARNQL